MHRQVHDLARRAQGVRVIPPASPRPVGGHLRHAVVDQRAQLHAACRGIGQEGLPIGHAQHVVGVGRALDERGARDPGQVAQRRVVGCGVGPPSPNDLVVASELDPPHRCLDGVHRLQPVGREVDLVVEVVGLRGAVEQRRRRLQAVGQPVERGLEGDARRGEVEPSAPALHAAGRAAEPGTLGAQTGGQVGVIRRHHAAEDRRDRLTGVEPEQRGVPSGHHRPALPRGGEGMGTILHDVDASSMAPLGRPHDLRHGVDVHRIPEEVGRHDAARTRSDGRFQPLERHAVVVQLAVDEDRVVAAEDHGVRDHDTGVGRQDDLVALQPPRAQERPQPAAPVGVRDRVPGIEAGREIALEAHDLVRRGTERRPQLRGTDPGRQARDHADAPARRGATAATRSARAASVSKSWSAAMRSMARVKRSSLSASDIRRAAGT